VRPFRLVPRRAGAIGLALTAYDVWRRLPPHHRKRILSEARKHGPRIAATAAKKARHPKGPPKP
jgi:hypothetical protein